MHCFIISYRIIYFFYVCLPVIFDYFGILCCLFLLFRIPCLLIVRRSLIVIYVATLYILPLFPWLSNCPISSNCFFIHSSLVLSCFSSVHCLTFYTVAFLLVKSYFSIFCLLLANFFIKVIENLAPTAFVGPTIILKERLRSTMCVLLLVSQ